MKIGQASQEVSRVKMDAAGLPVIRGCPDAPASRMTTQELIALEQNALSEDATVNPQLGDAT
jgi:hypothetical protein